MRDFRTAVSTSSGKGPFLDLSHIKAAVGIL
jgi:hypothetical protein